MNLVVFLLAGYETTSTTLAYAFYVLATNKAEQEKLINEIDEQFPNESDVSI
jgi:cytochrome P450 family 3 subfamily A